MATFEVKMTCTVTKIVTCEAETEEQVREMPWDYSTDEVEVDMRDWEIVSIDRKKWP